MTFVVRYAGHGSIGLRERRKKPGSGKKILAGEIQNHPPSVDCIGLVCAELGCGLECPCLKLDNTSWNIKNGWSGQSSLP
jgi:hypothetical protein